MQVSAVNSTNFGNSYYMDISRDDIEKAEQISQALRNYNDIYVSSEDIPNKKNVLGVITSVGIGLVGIFMLTKKGLKSAELVIDSVKKSSIAQSAAKAISEFTDKSGVKDKLSNLTGSIIGSKFVKDAKATFNVFQKNTSMGQKLTSAVNNISKLGRDNIIAGATSLGATAYVATTDGDGNGIPDIAEKGVNAYKNALGRIDAIKDFVDLVS